MGADAFSDVPVAAALPLGYKGVRGAVLVELKRDPGLTARDLARRLGMALNTLRHHLKELEAEGVVEYERRHGGVGAPGFAYRLSGAGEALFPRRYEETLTQLLDHVVAREGRAAAVALLEGQFRALTERLQGELVGASRTERMAAVVRALNQQGYMAEGRAGVCCGTLSEHNCAIRAVAQRFPEICAAEARFLAEVLDGRIERRAHMLAGCSACEYTVRFRVPESAAADPVSESSVTSGSEEIA